MLLTVFSDTGPLNYLILTGYPHCLPVLFDSIRLPPAVWQELSHPKTPAAVREFIATAPAWLKVVPNSEPAAVPSLLRSLDLGEQQVLLLAQRHQPCLILMDDRAAVRVAEGLQLPVAGTLSILYRAAQAKLLHLEEAFDRLSQTIFRYPSAIARELIRQFNSTD